MENEMNEYQINEYEIAFLCGVVIAALWIVAYLLCRFGQWAWAWVDDAKVGKRNLIVNWLAMMQGYTHRDPGYDTEFVYWNKDKSDSAVGILPFLQALLATSIAPMAIVIAFKLYAVTLIVLTLMVTAWVARFSRRHKKLFDKHIVDKDAHN
jgi:hypothetical protein